MLTESGFTSEDLDKLKRIQSDTLRQFTYASDMETHGVAEYWPSFKDIGSAALHNAPFKEDCDGFAIVCMDKAALAGFPVRLVVCLDELGEGHCICEVSSRDKTQAYYFDNRRHAPVTAGGEVGYKFLAVSPYNPQPGEQRPWELVDQQPT